MSPQHEPFVQTSSLKSKRRLWVFIPLLAFFSVALIFAVALRNSDPSKLPSALIGRPAPKIAFAELQGLKGPSGPVPGFTAEDLAKGEITIVNFWSSWCAPCLEEHPLLSKLAASSGAKVYGVNYKDKPEAALRFLTRNGNPFHAVGVDPKGRGAIEWGVYGMPETFIVNGRGEIAYKQVGPLTQEILQKKFLPALKSAAEQQPNNRVTE